MSQRPSTIPPSTSSGPNGERAKSRKSFLGPGGGHPEINCKTWDGTHIRTLPLEEAVAALKLKVIKINGTMELEIQLILSGVIFKVAPFAAASSSAEPRPGNQLLL